MNLVTINSDMWLRNVLASPQIRSYDTPQRHDMAVCICYFSYCRYQKTLHNLLTVLQDLRQAHIPHYVIELLYPNQTSVVPNPHMVVRAQTVMFHKENLYNVLAPHIPAQHSKLLFLDADIRFTRPNWYDLASGVLNEATVMQPMSTADWKNRCAASMVGAVLSGETQLRLAHHHPGFAMGIRRDLFCGLGGFYDKAVIGSGDTIFWHAILQTLGLPSIASEQLAQHTRCYDGINQYEHNCQRYAQDIKLGCVPFNTALHLPHGSQKNRQYQNRSKGWNIESCDIYKNDDGVYEWSNPKHDKYMREYFKSRKEDD